jgi:hypothetical protein
MKKFIDLLGEATGLKKIGRIKTGNVPEKETMDALKKFAMRQGYRAGAKAGSGTVVPRVRGIGGNVSSSEAILAQFGTNVFQDPTTKQYSSSRWTPTEDMALTGYPKKDREMVDLVKKTFVQKIKTSRSLGSNHTY